MTDPDATYTCQFCHAVIPEWRLPRDCRPAESDELGWMFAAELHNVGCDWVHHRGHRRKEARAVFALGKMPGTPERSDR